MDLKEIIILPDREFMEKLHLLDLEGALKEGMYRWEKEDVRELLKEKLKNRFSSTIAETPSEYNAEDIDLLCAMYEEAKKNGTDTVFLKRIHDDLEMIRKSSILARWTKDYAKKEIKSSTSNFQPRVTRPKTENNKVSPKYLNPAKYPVTQTSVNDATREISKKSYMNYLVFGDSHGRLEPVKAAFKDADKQFGDNYKMIVAGDVIDRGPYGIETLQYLMSMGNKVVFMPGNHELMMKDTFDVLKSHNKLPNGKIDWQGVHDDLRFWLLYIGYNDAEYEDLKEKYKNRHGDFLKSYAPKVGRKGYEENIIKLIELWTDSQNGGKQTLPAIVGNMQGLREVPEERVISYEQLESILGYIDKSSLLVPINNLHDSKNPEKTRAILIGHSTGGSNKGILRRLRTEGIRPKIAGMDYNFVKEVTSSREEKYRKQLNNPIKLAAEAGFDELIHGHEPVSSKAHVKSEKLDFGGRKIRFTSIDGGMASMGGRLNVYHLNSQTVKQYDTLGRLTGTADLSKEENMI